MYRVFLGAPSARELRESTGNETYRWTTITYPTAEDEANNSASLNDMPLPPLTLEAATERISLLYQNIIFNEIDDEEYEMSLQNIEFDADESQIANETTAITWPPTATRQSISRQSISFSRFTQETSYAGSDGSSIMHFPQFHFNVNTLASISYLKTLASAKVNSRSGSSQSSTKIPALLVAILEVTGPEILQLKKGPDAGKEIYLLKMILGNKEGICKLTAWRDVARLWGDGDARVKRGDIVLLEKLSFGNSADNANTGALTLTASSFLNSSLQLCYRCFPYRDEDMRYRPDLRLAAMGVADPCVRAVKGVVEWFESMAGLKT